MIALTLLAVALVVGLLLVPLGLPGLWVMLAATCGYWLAVPGGSVGVLTVIVVATLVIAAEVVEFAVAGRYARQYGGSRRASWGAILGGLVGAVVGVPVPVVGSMVGAFAGAFGGALVAELTVPRERRGVPVQVAKGALIGRVVAAALKVGFGVAILFLVGAAGLVGRMAASG
ncbi:DUF456 family protein [Gemmatimonas sp.]|jgi:uncharacterized protein YqgC (DUF456 family)|uniref:DUF456 family protein n=1 Tax=Gemmatimonas sp. TaxID=1962908 RepID=UPI0022CC30E1|nr:DUF456 family protein [Gemmatimonas sp.]MCZ8205147.1 DUF456 family protein [Gemmatimonas sp.]